MVQTQCHVHSLGITYDSIHVHESYTAPIKSYLVKFRNTKISPELLLLVLSCSI